METTKDVLAFINGYIASSVENANEHARFAPDPETERFEQGIAAGMEKLQEAITVFLAS